MFDLAEEDAERLVPGADIRLKFARSGEKVVFLADLDARTVIIKFYPPDYWPRRMQNEISAMMQLNSPYVAKLIRFVFQVADFAACYAIEEFIEGPDLLALILQGAPLSTRQTLELLQGALMGLDQLWSKGLVHGDITPRNIIVRPDGRPAIIDFGLVRHMDRPCHGAMATLPFASPEVLGGCDDQIDTRADIYSLGMSLYCLVNEGVHPIWDDNLPLDQNTARMLTMQASALSEIRAGVDPGLSEILFQMVRLDPEERFKTPQAALERVNFALQQLT